MRELRFESGGWESVTIDDRPTGRESELGITDRSPVVQAHSHVQWVFTDRDRLIANIVSRAAMVVITAYCLRLGSTFIRDQPFNSPSTPNRVHRHHG